MTAKISDYKKAERLAENLLKNSNIKEPPIIAADMAERHGLRWQTWHQGQLRAITPHRVQPPPTLLLQT